MRNMWSDFRQTAEILRRMRQAHGRCRMKFGDMRLSAAVKARETACPTTANKGFVLVAQAVPPAIGSRMSVLAFVFIATASAAIDGTVINGTTGKPQPNATVTLFQTSNQGPQDLGSVKTDAQGKFLVDKDVQPGRGGGPLLLQAVYGGVQYNKVITPGMPTTGVQIPVFETSKTQGDAKIDQHMILLEPSPNGQVKVSETYVFKNEGKTTWNDPDRGTLQFALPPA